MYIYIDTVCIMKHGTIGKFRRNVKGLEGNLSTFNGTLYSHLLAF